MRSTWSHALELGFVLSLLHLPSASAACPADIAPAGGNGVVNTDDLLVVIGSWGACPGACPRYCAADITHNCVVNTDDLLQVIGGWGECPCVADVYEPNNDCSTGSTLGTLGSDQTVTYTTMNLSATGDVDYFRIPCLETDSSCACGSFSFDEDYIIKVTLMVPASATGPYEICMNTGTCSFPSGYCFSVAPGETITLSQNLDGACNSGGPSDSYTCHVRISSSSPPGPGCQTYTLTTFFDAGYCF